MLIKIIYVYEKLSEKFNFENKMTESQFYNVLNKAQIMIKFKLCI